MSKDQRPFLPEATAAWLIKNTKLTFKQISDFCQVHIFKIESMSDGTTSRNIQETCPVSSGQLTQEEIERCQKDPGTTLKLNRSLSKGKSKKSYVPLTERKNKTKAILWLLKSFPNVKDNQITKLIGASKNAINLARKLLYSNTNNVQSQSPVELDLCTTKDLEKISKEIESS